MKCRSCDNDLTQKFVDLGTSPPSNDYLSSVDLSSAEVYLPLKVYVCSKCHLVQTIDYSEAEALFTKNYAYFSSVSKTLLKHASDYAEKIINKLNLDESSLVIELASNDGYLLKNFLEKKIPCLGVEPTESTASVAESLGIRVIKEFFGTEIAKKIQKSEGSADLVIGNNVYAHVPDINDFTLGIKEILNSEGTLTLEFAHVYSLIKDRQFDSIYHEHYCYLSLLAVVEVFNICGLRVYDVEKIETHGGSLRIYGCHQNSSIKETDAVKKVLNQEIELGLDKLDVYASYQELVDLASVDVLNFLVTQKVAGKKVVGYGAAAKASTLLNYIGVKKFLIDYICDASPHKAGKFIPGCRIPIEYIDALKRDKPEYIVIFAWNLKDEIISQLEYCKEWGAKFVTLLPSLKIHH